MQKGKELKDQLSRSRLRELGELFTVEEIATKAKVGRDTVYEWIETKKLRALRVGRGWRIPEQYFLEDILCLGQERSSSNTA